MRILHIIPSYLPAIYASGPIKPTHYLNKALVEKGVEVVVYTMNMDRERKLNVPLEKEIDLDGVKTYYFPVSFLPWQYSYKLHRALAKNIKNFDLIHITSVFLSVSTLGAYYARKFGIPYIISSHGSLMAEPLRRRSLKKEIYINLIEKRNLANASAIHFLVEKEKEDYLKANLPLKKAIIIPNSLSPEEPKEKPVPTFFRNKFKIPKAKKIILFLARLHPIKGLDTLIPAFAAIRGMARTKRGLTQKDIVLVLAGPDEENYKEEVIKTINSYNLSFFDFSQRRSALSPHESAPCIFTGMLLSDDKIAAFQESDIFALPSYSECLPMALVEAMAAGLPVVITKGVAISNEVEKAGAGLVVEKDVNQLAEAILKILENPEMAKEMGGNGRRLVEEKFSSEKVAERFIKEYNKIIEIKNER